MLYVLKMFVSVLSSQITKNKNYCVTFFPLHIMCFRTFRLGRGLIQGREQGGFTIWMMMHPCLVWL